MGQRTSSNSVFARILASAVWGFFCVLILVPPILASRNFHIAAAGIYLCFSRICHQAPGRVFTLSGYLLAVCHRCSGIYLGFFLGSFLRNPWMHRSLGSRRNWILAAAALLALDALAPSCGLWTNTPGTRFCTGLLFGIVASSLLVQGIAEFLTEAPWRQFAHGISHQRGGLS